MTEARKKRINTAAAIIVAAGLTAALFIYLSAANNDAETPGQFIFDNSKQHMRNLEVLGGKENIMAADFVRWFEGLWRGRQLAFTVAWVSIFCAGAFLMLARNYNPNKHSDDKNSGPTH